MGSKRVPEARVAEGADRLFPKGAEWARLGNAALAKRTLPDGLTAREAEILRRVAARRTNREIAEELVISVHTVERHVQNVYRKIGVNNRAQAAAYARESGI